MNILRTLFVVGVAVPLVVACASQQNPPTADGKPQVSCAGVAPAVGTHIVRKKDCEPLSQQEVEAQRQRFEAMQQAQETERARRDAAPTPPMR